MRYKWITSKFSYYVRVVIAVTLCLTSIAIFDKLVESDMDEVIMLAIFAGSGAAILMLTYLNLFRNIYGAVDLDRNTFCYGNILFDQEIPIASVKMVKKRLLSFSYVVQIGDSNYYVLPNDAESLNVFIERTRSHVD